MENAKNVAQDHHEREDRNLLLNTERATFLPE
jgi:hypothetical protein